MLDCLRDKILPALNNGIINITRNEATTVANILTREKAESANVRTNIKNELFGIIENYIAGMIHRLSPADSLSASELLANANIELGKAKYEIEKPFKIIRTIPVEPEEDLLNFSPMHKLIGGENIKDIEHLISAVQY